MNNKTAAFGALFFLMLSSCNNEPGKKGLAKYIGSAENGLTKKIEIEKGSIVCQLIPEFKEGQKHIESSELLHFNVYINTAKELVTDSIYYKFGYHSKEMFRAVIGKDTLTPVLSELMANGRRDKNQFTVLFEPSIMKAKDSLIFIINKTELIKQDTKIKFYNNDINKAYKNIY